MKRPYRQNRRHAIRRVRYGLREKLCNRCDRWRPQDTMFRRCRSSVDGRAGRCRICHRNDAAAARAEASFLRQEAA